MINHLTKNWGAKIICLAAASILWSYVSISQNMVTKLPGSIKIKAVNISDNYAVQFDQKTVEISVKAKSSIWQNLTVDSFTASVDLAGISSGTHELPVNVFTVLSDVQIIEKTPSRITVSVEPVVSKDFTINPKINGDSASGMVVGGVTFATSRVNVKGAKSVIDSISDLNAVITLAEEKASFSKEAIISAYDSDGKVVSGISIDPAKVGVDVSIIKGSNIKSVGIKPKIVGDPSPSYFVSSITITPDIVDISGVKDMVMATKYLETLPVDITGANDNLERDTYLSLPNGVALLGGISAKIHVAINVDYIEGNHEVKIQSSNFMPKNLGSYSVESYSASEVTLLIKGQPDPLNTSNAYNLNFDFLGKTLHSGDYTFELTSDNFVIPQGVTLVSFSPKTVSIKLRNN